MEKQMIQALARTRRVAERKLADGESAFEKMLTAFKQAKRNHPHPVICSYYSFAGLTARFRIAGQELARHVAAPFAHLSISGEGKDAVELEVDLWDENECEISYPEELRDLVEGVSDPNLERRVIIGDKDRFIVTRCRSMITWFDRARRHMIGWVSAGDRLSLYERGHPMRFPLLIWHADHGVQVLHAGFVARNGDGVLFAGKAGAGKTTAALWCVGAGFDYLGDDYVGIKGLKGGNFEGYSIYNTAWLEPDGSRVPFLAGKALQPESSYERRKMVLVSDVFPRSLASSAEISVVMIPRQVSGFMSRTTPVSKGRALLAVAPSSLLHLPGSGDHRLQDIAELIERVPTYWLDMGRDFEAIPSCVEATLNGIISKSVS
jgi:hypothetical protein